MPFARRNRRRFALAVLALGAVAFGYVRYTGNFGTVAPGRVYRSGQLSAGALAKTVRALGVKTVLNLRGPNPDRAWYREELAATTAAGATQVDFAMSSSEWLSRSQLRALVRTLDSAEYPVLIHCEWGSERTGLVSAVSELLRPGGRLADAENQFTIRHMFLRVKDGKVMAEHLDEYAAWLARNEWGHSPSRFRAWADGGYVPRGATREDWPYNPYPLVSVTRPERPTAARR